MSEASEAETFRQNVISLQTANTALISLVGAYTLGDFSQWAATATFGLLICVSVMAITVSAYVGWSG